MIRIHEDRRIKHSVLRKLPGCSTIGPLVKVEDMDGILREAVIVSWMDTCGSGFMVRYGYFCIEAGEYLGDHIPEDGLLDWEPDEIRHPLDR